MALAPHPTATLPDGERLFAAPSRTGPRGTFILFDRQWPAAAGFLYRHEAARSDDRAKLVRKAWPGSVIVTVADHEWVDTPARKVMNL